MPVAQYVNVFEKRHITKNILTPKRITELKYWLKECQKTIKEMPQVIAESEGMVDHTLPVDKSWFVATYDVDVKWIKFNLENRLGEKAHVVIDRSTRL